MWKYEPGKEEWVETLLGVGYEWHQVGGRNEVGSWISLEKQGGKMDGLRKQVD